MIYYFIYIAKYTLIGLGGSVTDSKSRILKGCFVVTLCSHWCLFVCLSIVWLAWPVRGLLGQSTGLLIRLFLFASMWG